MDLNSKCLHRRETPSFSKLHLRLHDGEFLAPCLFDVDEAHGWHKQFRDAFFQILQPKGTEVYEQELQDIKNHHL